jgi:hypothetical protein
MARRWRLDIALLAPRHCRAGSSASLRWRLGVVAIVLLVSSCWRLGIEDIVALAHRRCRAGVCRHCPSGQAQKGISQFQAPSPFNATFDGALEPRSRFEHDSEMLTSFGAKGYTSTR